LFSGRRHPRDRIPELYIEKQEKDSREKERRKGGFYIIVSE
jgi:hypothetical protein